MKSLQNKLLLFINWCLEIKGTTLILLAFSVLIFLVTVLQSVSKNGPGFPLDDSWIHLTYARSIAENGTWSYSLNQTSAGSTSPLWTILLVPGFLFGAKNPFVWTLFLSWVSYLGLILLATRQFSLLFPDKQVERLVMGIILLFEWHVVWAAGSGMETILFSLGVVGVFYLLYINANTILIGFVIGLVVCIRPEGLTLLGPAILVGTAQVLAQKVKNNTLLGLFIGFVIPLLFYVYHNYSITGAFLPNTFFAKSAEYGSLRSIFLGIRFLNLAAVLISGAGLFLLPGFFRSAYEAAKKRDIWLTSAVLWVIGFLIIYAIRLPVVYQHGRYLIPVIPMFYLVGFSGTLNLVSLLKPIRQKFYNLVALVTLITVSLIFWVQGVSVFSTDVQTINKLMVEPAIWLKDHTASNSIVAAHDIGAIGFFSERRIIDLAGLIDPQVVPFINDESRLQDFINKSGAHYLVVFSDWYSELGTLGEFEIEFAFQQDSVQKTVVIRDLR